MGAWRSGNFDDCIEQESEPIYHCDKCGCALHEDEYCAVNADDEIICLECLYDMSEEEALHYGEGSLRSNDGEIEVV